MNNSHGEELFKNFKYLSSARIRWRENAEEIIFYDKYNKIQLIQNPMIGIKCTTKQFVFIDYDVKIGNNVDN